jgi:hypothetical protein
MNWTVSEGPSLDDLVESWESGAAPKGRTFIEGAIDARDWTGVSNQLVEFWHQVARVFPPIIAADRRWDRLMIGIEPGGGSFFAHLRDSSDEMRTSPATLIAAARLMEEEYYALPAADESPDDFEREHDALCARGRDAVLAALRHPDAKSALARLAATGPLLALLHWNESQEPDQITLPA